MGRDGDRRSDQPMYEAFGAGAGKPVLTNVALVIAEPTPALMVQEVLNQFQEVEIRLAIHRPADLAALPGRERVHLIVCEAIAAEEIHGLRHPDQRLVVLARGRASAVHHRDLALDVATPGWSTALAAFARPHNRSPIRHGASPPGRPRWPLPPG